jgi:hypothetical protein
MVWDDSEERRYRDWLREEQQKASEYPADWSETEAEEVYRARLKQEAENREDQTIEWEDDKEKEFRRKYIQMR